MTGNYYTFVVGDPHELLGIDSDDVLALVRSGQLSDADIEIDGECLLVDADKLDAVLGAIS